MYSFTIDVPAPIEAYDALHQALVAKTGGQVPGLLIHIGRATETGFQVLEVWQDEATYRRFDAEIVAPMMARFAGGHEPAALPVQPFDLRGFITAGEPVVV